MTHDPTPTHRVRACNAGSVRADRELVLYWMTAARRTRYHFGLQRAIEHARELDRPLVVLEALSSDYPWASDRLHAFVLAGMRANRDALADRTVSYYPYVEPKPGAGRGLVAALADRACVVVTDDYPCFRIPSWTRTAAAATATRLEQVDSNGLFPMHSADRAFPTAHGFRRFLQRELPDHLDEAPAEDPLSGVELPELDSLPAEITRRWSPAQLDEIELGDLPIDHAVAPVGDAPGGSAAAERELARFLDSLEAYVEDRNRPTATATSRLSPYLHFGHIASHEVFTRLIEHERWSPDRLATTADGKREGWWGMSPSAEAFVDQLITWRELGFNMCSQNPDYDSYDSLPDWARATLEIHATDTRPVTYELEEFEAAATGDALWNAAQTELVETGRIHNYLRMLWGKKILEWTPTPRDALAVMIELNNKYALDGRDPNSYSGIFWCLGRYDRAWGPERPIFGKIRYMSSENTARKYRVREYLDRFGAEAASS